LASEPSLVARDAAAFDFLQVLLASGRVNAISPGQLFLDEQAETLNNDALGTRR
jgi:hypothetical protein